jgi:FixJ family two-component response regulator
VLDLLADGCSNPQIAAALFISRKTASAHVSKHHRQARRDEPRRGGGRRPPPRA